MTSEVREALGGHKATFFATLLYSREGWREEEIVKVIKDGHEVANHCKVRGGGEAGGWFGGGGARLLTVTQFSPFRFPPSLSGRQGV